MRVRKPFPAAQTQGSGTPGTWAAPSLSSSPWLLRLWVDALDSSVSWLALLSHVCLHP